MKKAAALMVLLAGGCMEPPRTGQMEQAISGLAHLKSWDAEIQGRGQYGYDAVIGRMPDVLPFLLDHLTDPTPTAIYHEQTGRNPNVGDVCFLILLKALNRPWEDFADDGVFISSALPNPIFCIRWENPASRRKVQTRMRPMIPEVKE